MTINVRCQCHVKYVCMVEVNLSWNQVTREEKLCFSNKGQVFGLKSKFVSILQGFCWARWFKQAKVYSTCLRETCMKHSRRTLRDNMWFCLKRYEKNKGKSSNVLEIWQRTAWVQDNNRFVFFHVYHKLKNKFNWKKKPENRLWCGSFLTFLYLCGIKER